MDDFLVADPYVWMAFAAYFGVVVVGAGLRTAYGLMRGRGAWRALEAALASVGRERTTVGWAPLADGRFLLYASGGQAAVVDPAADRPPVLRPVTRVALVKDMDRQTGLVVTLDGENHCVTGLDAMARLWRVLQLDAAKVRIVFRDDAGAAITQALQRLGEQTRSLVTEWLTPDEIVTDVITGVDYEGTTGTAGERAFATLIVTNLRVGLLAATRTSQQQGGQIRTTTHLSLLTYLLPLAEHVTFERTPGFGSNTYVVRLALPPEHANTKAPNLKLGPDHAGMLLPLVVFGRPVSVRDPGAGFGPWLRATLAAGIGWGLLWGLLVFGASWTLWEGGLAGSRSWWYRYTLPMVLAGVLTPGLMRGSRFLVETVERLRAALLTPATEPVAA